MYISLHPQYFMLEGFGTLMSHYSVLYSIYKDTGSTPAILHQNNPKEKDLKNMTAMQFFNQHNEPILYHEDVFPNIKKFFHILDTKKTKQTEWGALNLENFKTYNDILKKIKVYQNYNLLFIWNLNFDLVYRNISDLKEFLYKFDKKIINRCKKILPKSNKEIVAVCVRNEYKKLQSGHIKLSLNYYKEAMSCFDSKNTKFLFFSDDIIETKETFKPLESFLDIEYTESMPSAIGMCLMSMCDHIICANSSFSYWASILNNNTNAKIICSCKFLEDIHNSSIDINYKWYPEHWTALDVV